MAVVRAFGGKNFAAACAAAQGDGLGFYDRLKYGMNWGVTSPSTSATQTLLGAAANVASSSELDQQLETDKKNTLVETNAQAIFETLTKLREFHSENRRRWIWELLQNACDAVDPKVQKNRVHIYADEKKLRLNHIGAAFGSREISHLIYHGSTKQEGEKKRGKFGSGFLTIHLISHRVRISGILGEKGETKSFEFVLDRSGTSSREIQRNMEVAWRDFKHALHDVEHNPEFTTGFECELDGDAAFVVESGLSELEKTAPYVLAFVRELDEITIAGPGKRTSWRRSDQNVTDGTTITDIIRESSDGSKLSVRVVTVGDWIDGVGVGAALMKTASGWEFQDDRDVPRLFYPLPLVETQALGVPFVMVSEKFEPTPERNGIYARAATGAEESSAINWALLRQVPNQYEKLTRVCASEAWKGCHNLVRLCKPPANKPWLDAALFASEVALKALSFLRGKEAPGFILNQKEELLPPRSARIPVNDSDGKIYSLAKRVLAARDLIPKSAIAGEWAAIIDGWSGLLGKKVEELNESLTVNSLGDWAAECKTLAHLDTILGDEEGGAGLQWLNELLACVPKEQLQSFVRSRSVLPNQKGGLKKENELRLDDNIDETIKDVCEKLDTEVRGELLHTDVYAPIRQVFEMAKGRVFHNEECIERAIRRLKDPATEDTEALQVQANATLLAWLASHERVDKLKGYIVHCAEGRGELRTEKALFVPASLWNPSAKEFIDVFSDGRRLKETYAAVLSDKNWVYLEKSGFILQSVFVPGQALGSFESAQVAESLDELIDHKPATAVTLPQIAFLRGDGGLLDEVRRSKAKAKRFLRFLLKFVITEDASWKEGHEVMCSCGKAHRVLPEWMFHIKAREWVPIGKSGDERPSASNVWPLLKEDEDLKQLILNDDDCAKFLLKLGIGVSELLKSGVPEDKRFQLDRLSARIYAAGDEGTIQSIEAVLDDPDLKQAVLNKKQEKARVARNQELGRTVESLLRKELESAGIKVTRTGTGSDFEVESDFIENGTEQIIEVGSFLLEVKSTTEAYARMTLRQGEEACKKENEDRYALCVVPVIGEKADEESVRGSFFVFGVGALVEQKVKEARTLKVFEGALAPKSGEAVAIDIVESSLKLRVARELWEKKGVSFIEFVAHVKGQP